MKNVEFQSDGLWLVAVQPVGFVLFLICMVAETNRTPFDIPEGESELTGGFHTEYSGMRFAMFFLGEYAALIVMALFGTVLYLGGWHGPPSFAELAARTDSLTGLLGVIVTSLFWLVIIAALLFIVVYGARKLKESINHLTPIVFGLGGMALILLHVFGSLTGLEFLHLGPVWVFVKVVFLIFLAMMARWTYLRLRVDQLTSFAWKFLFPLALLNLFVTGIVVMLIYGK
ncbi:MAG: complex I subunit 1 family protein [Planctomycetota bacterium]|nr:complex I subunit 1 family protein [Planctomycetota bacterium]